MKRLLFFAGAVILGLGFTPGRSLQAQQPAPGATQQDQIQRYVDAMRSDIRTEKKAILTRAMQFTPQEDTAFWPIYNNYLAEMGKLGDERLSIIKTYANNYQQMTDSMANDLAKRSIAVQKQRTALLEKTYEQVLKVMPAKRAVRFLQVENALNQLIDIQLTAEIPLME
jgi:hypothetical protein